MPVVRKPLAAMMTPDRDVDGATYRGDIIVVCDDGAVFSHAREGYWQDLEPIPGTRAAIKKAKAE